jgi:hypothetical protein
VFSSGEVLDLDLRTVICKYQMQAPLPVTGPSPDGRVWRVAQRPAGKEKQPARGREGAGKAELLLAAATLPHAGATALIDRAREGLLWHPGSALRLEVDKSVPKGQREKLLQAMSDAVTQAGVRVDPAAKVRMTVRTKVERKAVTGKRTQVLGPTLEEREVVSGYVLEARFEITDLSGRPVMRQPYFGMGISAPDYSGTGEEDVWSSFRGEVRRGLRFPRLFLRDASGAMLTAKQFFSPGIDDLVDAAVLPPQGHSGTDEFKLPDDPK